MKKLLALLLASVILCGAVACSSGETTESTKSTTAATETTKETQTDGKTAVITAEGADAEKTMNALDKTGFQGVVYIEKKGKVVATFAKGKMENGEPITIDTPLPIGSVTKQFCAAAILLLQEQGKLSIDDTLSKYYPEHKDGDKITLKHMLAMRSGIPDYLNYGNDEETKKVVSKKNSDDENAANIVKWILNKELEFEPDGQFMYSNSNYFLLSYIVEKVSGEKFNDFIRNNFLEPLGMTHTGFFSELESNPEWAQGHTYKKAPLLPGLLPKGDGNIISTGADMALWMNGLRSGKVISTESFKAMATNYSDADNYGFGLEVNVLDGVGHSGGIGDYSAYDYMNEYQDMVIFMASNTMSPGCDPHILGDMISFMTD